MNTLYDYFLFTPRTKHFLLPEVAVRTSTHNAVPHFSFQITFSPHSLNRHILTVSYSASLWGILSSFVLFYGFQWCCTQHSPADILISYLISCCKTPSHCWWDITLRRSTLKKKKEDISHDNRLKQFTVNCFQKIWIQINLLSSTVKQL